MGAFAVVEYDGSLKIKGFISDLEGKEYIEATAEGHAEYPEVAGVELAKKLLKQGGEKILCNLRKKEN
jgi:hydroxymethylbilane synthase